MDYRRLRYALALVLFPYQSSFPFSLPLSASPMYSSIFEARMQRLFDVSETVLKRNQLRRKILRLSLLVDLCPPITSTAPTRASVTARCE